MLQAQVLLVLTLSSPAVPSSPLEVLVSSFPVSCLGHHCSLSALGVLQTATSLQGTPPLLLLLEGTFPP